MISQISKTHLSDQNDIINALFYPLRVPRHQKCACCSSV